MIGDMAQEAIPGLPLLLYAVGVIPYRLMVGLYGMLILGVVLRHD